MYLTKNGVTVEVDHPADIRRYKSLGYVEEPEHEPEAKKPETKKPEAGGKKEQAPKTGKKDGE